MSQTISPLSAENSAEPPQSEELLVQQNGAAPTYIPLTSPVVTLGRDVRNDVVLDTGAVSRLHARLESDQGIWYLTDLGSTNGTFLNTKKLAPYAPEAVNYNDEMKLGDFDIVLQIPGAVFGNIPPESTIRITPEPSTPSPPSPTEQIEEEPSLPAEEEAPEPLPDLPDLPDPADAQPEEQSVDQISLARQLFGGLDDYHPAPLPDLPTLPLLPVKKTVPSAIAYSFSIWPNILLNNGQVMVSIQNESSNARTFEIEVLGADGVAIAQDRFSAEITAGSEHREQINLRTTSRPFMGDQRKYPYKVRVSADDGDTRELTGDILVEPRLTTAMVIFAVGLSLTLALIWIASQLI